MVDLRDEGERAGAGAGAGAAAPPSSTSRITSSPSVTQASRRARPGGNWHRHSTSACSRGRGWEDVRVFPAARARPPQGRAPPDLQHDQGLHRARAGAAEGQRESAVLLQQLAQVNHDGATRRGRAVHGWYRGARVRVALRLWARFAGAHVLPSAPAALGARAVAATAAATGGLAGARTRRPRDRDDARQACLPSSSRRPHRAAERRQYRRVERGTERIAREQREVSRARSGGGSSSVAGGTRVAC